VLQINSTDLIRDTFVEICVI